MVIEEGTGSQLYVKGLTPDITEETLEHTFARFGQISQVLIVRDKETQACKGFGFVTFESRDDARDALKAMDKKELNGSEIHVEEAAGRRSPSFRRGGGRGGRGGWSGPSSRGGGGGYRGRGGPPRGRGGGRFEDRGSRYESDRYEDRFEPDRRDRGDRDHSRSDRGQFKPRGGRFESRGGGGGRFESNRDRFESDRGERPSYSRGGGGGYSSGRGGGGGYSSGRGGGGGYSSSRGGGFRDSYGSRDGQRDYNSREFRDRSPIRRDSRGMGVSSSRDRNSLLAPPRDRDGPSRRDSRGYGGGSDYRGGQAPSRDYGSPPSREYGGGGGRDYGASNGREYAAPSRDYSATESRDYGGRSEYSGGRYESAPPRRNYDSVAPSRSFSDSGRPMGDSYGGGGYDSGPRSSSRSMGMDNRRDDRMRDGGMRRGPPPSRDFAGPPTKRPRGGPPRSPPMRRGDSPPPRALSFSRGGRGGGRGRGGPPSRRY